MFEGLTGFEVKLLDDIVAVLEIGPPVKTTDPKAKLCQEYVFGYVPVIYRWGGVEEMKKELIHMVRHTIMSELNQKLGGKPESVAESLLRPLAYRDYQIRFLKYPKVEIEETKKVINEALAQSWIRDPSYKEETLQKTVRLVASWMIEKKYIEV